MTLDGFNEKKWFVYLGDHHEGPFSLADIQDRLSAGQVSSTNYAWREGMADWRMMSELEAFESLLHPSSRTKTTFTRADGGEGENDGPSIIIEDSSPEIETPTPSMPALFSPQSGQVEPPPQNIVAIETTGNNQRSSSTVELLSLPGEPRRRHRSKSAMARKSMKLLIVLLFFGGMFYSYRLGYLNPIFHAQGLQASVRAIQEATDPYLDKVSDYIPALAKYISPIPHLEDVSPEEYADLKIAARAQLKTQGPLLAVALANADASLPAFYLASNLPDGSQLDVYVQGVPDTLLNQLWFDSKVGAAIKKKIGKTEVVRFPDGKPLPRGQYSVYVAAAENQPPAVHALMDKIPTIGKTISGIPKSARVFLTKTYFLGGAKDEVYTSRLKEFHDKLMAKATGELAELKQFSTSLDSQLTGTLSRFNDLKRGKGKPTLTQKKNWGAFSQTWNQFNSQLADTFKKWTPDAIQNQFFYGMLYQTTLSTAQAIQSLHDFQDRYFSGLSNPRAFEIQIGEATSFAQSAMTGLQAKIEQAEKIPPSPNGMPQKEGL